MELNYLLYFQFHVDKEMRSTINYYSYNTSYQIIASSNMINSQLCSRTRTFLLEVSSKAETNNKDVLQLLWLFPQILFTLIHSSLKQFSLLYAANKQWTAHDLLLCLNKKLKSMALHDDSTSIWYNNFGREISCHASTCKVHSYNAHFIICTHKMAILYNIPC